MVDESGYKLLLMASCVRSVPKLKNAPMKTNILEGGTIASFLAPLYEYW